MGKCILAIDIGNTAAKVGFYRNGRLLDFKSIKNSTVPKYMNNIVKSGKIVRMNVIICSVVPNIAKKLTKSVLKNKRLKLWVAGANLPIQIRHKYLNYNKLGIDRKVNIYGALKMYRLPILVIGLGTAVTFDYIDSRGTFQGGLIIPGPETAYTSLLSRGALLPKGRKFPAKAKSFPGRDTVSCLEAGILEGYGAMIDGLIQRFKKRFGPKLRVLATGGFAKTIAPYATGIDIIDPKHSIKSLLALWREYAARYPSKSGTSELKSRT